MVRTRIGMGGRKGRRADKDGGRERGVRKGMEKGR